jgi:hypothetical protein
MPIRGMQVMQKRLTTADFVQAPAGEFLRSWKEDLKNEAVKRAPKWRGDLARTIQMSQDTAKFPLWSRVFFDAPQARWMEYGTGTLSEDPKSARQRYFPPVDRIRDWSIDHGIEPYLLARGIFERGGTPPTHFFSDAEQAADAGFNSRLSRFGKDIERQAGIVP